MSLSRRVFFVHSVHSAGLVRNVCGRLAQRHQNGPPSGGGGGAGSAAVAAATGLVSFVGAAARSERATGTYLLSKCHVAAAPFRTDCMPIHAVAVVACLHARTSTFWTCDFVSDIIAIATARTIPVAIAIL